MESIEALQSILCEYEGTVLFVSHNRSFVNSIAQRLLVIKNGQVLEFEGNLMDYEDKSDISETKQSTQTQKLMLQMRITEVLSKLSEPNTNNDSLEMEYQELLSKLRML